jgi:hypothetical protein
MSEEPQNRQEILTGVNVGGNLTTGDITQTIFNTPQPMAGNPFAPPQPNPCILDIACHHQEAVRGKSSRHINILHELSP